MKLRHHLPAMALLGLTSSAFALKIEFRYDYDTNGFFNSAAAKAALEAAADFYEPLIHDSLAAINPAGGNTWEAKFTHPGNGTTQFPVANLVVPADTIIIFAGGRALSSAGLGGYGGYGASGSQAWFDLLACRGQTGALETTPTDFARWGGAITFDTGRTWNFSLTDPTAPGSADFLPIALHELGHALGLGGAPSWTTKISASTFTGAHAVQVYGGNVPLSGTGHWRDNSCGGTDGYLASDTNKILSKAYGAFGAPHGFPQIALMDPSVCGNGTFQKVMTDLDIAALRDVGWEIDPPLDLTVPSLDPSASPFVFSWPSTSGFTYRLQRSPSLAANSWTTLSTQTGNGTIQQFSTATPGLATAFYRLTTDVPAAGALFVEPPPLVPAPQSAPSIDVEGCQCGTPWLDH
ncbi:M10 family metallopeptidase domain-containing protein [Luteolibacter arcticus]|uniref:M10 family metallopeptidase domain-containing protein n=1 Tax=Luteolibacter arcticus TaxID=1581411 RepID=A0ABT3GR65_9BACT|nr:M10 family metallopeptidase domain-containing protein [Luteolibacter arcticus]MCW1925995.1 M10 family metallopeptidase domain-containing protein [Luteolibacter arcticus]